MPDTPAVNPLETSPELERRIAARAQSLWEADGSPVGRMDEYRERADELIRMEMAGNPAQLPNPVNLNDPLPGVIIEEASIQENYADTPGRMTDQGDWRQTPMTREELHHPEDRQPDHGETP